MALTLEWRNDMKDRAIYLIIIMFEQLEELQDDSARATAITECIEITSYFTELVILSHLHKQGMAGCINMVHGSRSTVHGLISRTVKIIIEAAIHDESYVTQDMFSNWGPLDHLLLKLTEVYEYAHLERWEHASDAWFSIQVDEDEDEQQEKVPEHVATQNFERYEEDDWFHREFELQMDLQDVLKGPERAQVQNVSDVAPVRKDFTCGICGEEPWLMRKLWACGHEFCAECLGAQLDTQHECRYRCPLCRAEFFEESAAGEGRGR